MAYTNASVIEMGAKHLLSLLAMESLVRYSRFYDGSEETSLKLEEAIGIEEECRGWYCAEIIMDFAIHQLAEQGIVESKELDEKLADGQKDYEVYLTPRGKQALLQNATFRFWDAE